MYEEFELTSDIRFIIDGGCASVIVEGETAASEIGTEGTLWRTAARVGKAFWTGTDGVLIGPALVEALNRVYSRLAGLAVTQTKVPPILMGAAAACGSEALRKQDSIETQLSKISDRINVVKETYAEATALGPIGRPGIKYPLIMADPPWNYEDNGSRLSAEHEKYYSYMTLREICLLGSAVRLASAKDAILLLWMTNTALLEARQIPVLKQWGFTAKTIVPWLKTTEDRSKPRIGGGHYVRGVSEPLIACSRGETEIFAEEGCLVVAARGHASNTVILNRGIPGVIIAPRVKKVGKVPSHSGKPPEGYELAEALANGPYLEMFARKARPGWDSYGSQAPETDSPWVQRTP